MLRQSLKSSAKQEAGDWKSSTVKKGFPGGTSGKKKTKQTKKKQNPLALQET